MVCGCWQWRPWHAGTRENATAHFITAGYVTVYNAAAPVTVLQQRPKGNLAASRQHDDTCPLFAQPNCTITSSDVVGFKNVANQSSCCWACNSSIACRFYEFRPTDGGCTMYSGVIAMVKNSGSSTCGSHVPPPHNFTFLTVKGAGHTIPEMKPVPALTMISKFFRGQQHS